eukprot:TRINITY_DN13932_c0_g1_i1.p1 TRINITY_DN13932_c0_g1~~TRINITY_DN13932_c0_g1_i1.p1  ORF type:complete len:169 (-),score=9.59 TRINITY_DN13932_c0_g1_i1:228-680(-)
MAPIARPAKHRGQFTAEAEGGKPVSRACLSDSGFALPQLETVAHCTADALDSLESAREILDEIESLGGGNDCNGDSEKAILVSSISRIVSLFRAIEVSISAAVSGLFSPIQSLERDAQAGLGVFEWPGAFSEPPGQVLCRFWGVFDGFLV